MYCPSIHLNIRSHHRANRRSLCVMPFNCVSFFADEVPVGHSPTKRFRFVTTDGRTAFSRKSPATPCCVADHGQLPCSRTDESVAFCDQTILRTAATFCTAPDLSIPEPPLPGSLDRAHDPPRWTMMSTRSRNTGLTASTGHPTDSLSTRNILPIVHLLRLTSRDWQLPTATRDFVG